MICRLELNRNKETNSVSWMSVFILICVTEIMLLVMSDLWERTEAQCSLYVPLISRSNERGNVRIT